MLKKFSVVGLLAASLCSVAEANDFDEILPAPERLLRSINSFGPQNQEDVFRSTETLCTAESQVRRPKYCGVSKTISEYEKLAAEVFGKRDGEIDFGSEVNRTSPWDLRHIISGSFAIFPDRTGEFKGSKGLNQVVSLLILRSNIIHQLGEMRNLYTRSGDFRDVRQVVLLPALHAYIQTSSPLGAMMRFHDRLGCRDTEVLCLQMRDRFGSAIEAVSRPYAERVRGFHTRIIAASDDSAPERLRRLRKIVSFAKQLNDADRKGRILTRDEVERGIEGLIADGQGIFGDDGYQNVARATISIVEALNVAESLAELSRSRNALSPIQRAAAVSALDPSVKESIGSIERALQIFAMSNDIGGPGL